MLAACLMVGCEPEKTSDFKPIENGSGFGYITRVRGVVDRKLQAGLVYKDTNGTKVIVWSYLQMLWGDNIQVTNNMAVFVGGRSELYDDGVERFRERLMAFEAPAAPAVDITDQAFQKYSAETGVEFTNIIKDSFVSLTKTNDSILILFGIIRIGERGPGTITDHDAYLMLSWHDIEAIIQDVKKTGTLHKEKRSGVQYLQKD
jgi:hypothetical protein